MRFFLKLTFLALLLAFCGNVSAQSSLKKGNKQYVLRDFPDAIKYYEKYLKRKPNNTQALVRIADSHRLLNDMTKAAEYYKRAFATGKPEPRHRLRYGKTLMSLGRYDAAREQFTLYASDDPAVSKQMVRSADFAQKNRNNPPGAEVNNEFINTSGDEYGVTLYGNKVAFNSTRQDLKRENDRNKKKKGEKPNQLFMTERDGSDFLRTPAFLHSDLKNQYGQGPIAYSPDGKWVAFTSNNFEEGVRHVPLTGMELNLYIAATEGEGDFSEAVAFPYNGDDYSTGYPAWSADGQTLYFASDRPDGFGGFDIYSSKRTGVSWTPPQNLGSVINSKGNEITPFEEGNSLFFASDMHDGFGGYDIFRGEKAGKRYTNIYHTGTAINSPADDFGYVYDTDADLGYFVSNRSGSKGGYDIYRVKKTTRRMVVSVTDERGQPIKGATIDFSDCGEGVFLTDANGLYSVQIKPGLDCTPTVRMTGYRSSTFKLNAASRDQKVRLVSIGNTTAGTGNNGTTRPGNNGNNNGTTTGGSPYPNTSTGGTVTTAPGEFLGFGGRVLDSRNGVGLPNVTIRATRATDGMVMVAESDSNGDYIIGLNPNTSYSLEYEKSGFFSADRSVRTGSTNDSSILGTTRIQSTSGGYVGTGSGSTGSSNTGSGNTGGTTTYPSGGNTNTGGGNTGYPTTGGGGYTPNTGGGYNPGTGGVSSGYAVQVAAVSANRNADLSKFSDLADLGTVYYAPAGNVYKIRVGLFTTPEQARAAAQSIKARGYDGAFMVTEGNVNIGTSTNTGSGNTGGYNPNAGGNYGSAKARYVVRLGAYSNPKKSFDRNSVADLGQIAEQFKGQFTIMLLTGYGSYDSALQALNAARQRGFTDAYVAEDVNGVLRKVK